MVGNNKQTNKRGELRVKTIRVVEVIIKIVTFPCLSLSLSFDHRSRNHRRNGALFPKTRWSDCGWPSASIFSDTKRVKRTKQKTFLVFYE